MPRGSGTNPEPREWPLATLAKAAQLSLPPCKQLHLLMHSGRNPTMYVFLNRITWGSIIFVHQLKIPHHTKKHPWNIFAEFIWLTIQRPGMWRKRDNRMTPIQLLENSSHDCVFVQFQRDKVSGRRRENWTQPLIPLPPDFEQIILILLTWHDHQ